MAVEQAAAVNLGRSETPCGASATVPEGRVDVAGLFLPAQFDALLVDPVFPGLRESPFRLA
jgi:hypothetical protein